VKDFINSEWLLDRTGSEDAHQIGLHSAPDVQKLTWTERPLLAQSGSRSKACGRLKVIPVVFAVGRLLPIYLQLQTCRHLR